MFSTLFYLRVVHILTLRILRVLALIYRLHKRRTGSGQRCVSNIKISRPPSCITHSPAWLTLYSLSAHSRGHYTTALLSLTLHSYITGHPLLARFFFYLFFLSTPNSSNPCLWAMMAGAFIFNNLVYVLPTSEDSYLIIVLSQPPTPPTPPPPLIIYMNLCLPVSLLLLRLKA